MGYLKKMSTFVLRKYPMVSPTIVFLRNQLYL